MNECHRVLFFSIVLATSSAYKVLENEKIDKGKAYNNLKQILLKDEPYKPMISIKFDYLTTKNY